MFKLTVQNLNNKELPFSEKGFTVLKVLQANYVDWMHACGGKGRCTTCKMKIVEGQENLGPLTVFEERYKDMQALKNDERLACQCVVFGDLTVNVPKQNQLPHLSYTS